METQDVIEKYRERMQLKYAGGADLAKISLWRFASAFEVRAGCVCGPSKKPRVLKLKPYLNLDAMRPRAADMARYALRLTRPFAGQADDPIELPDDEALAALEAWTLEADCPRWLRDRYRRHNKRRDTGGGGTRPTPNGVTDGEEAPKEEPVAVGQLSAKTVPLNILDREAVQRHGLPG